MQSSATIPGDSNAIFHIDTVPERQQGFPDKFPRIVSLRIMIVEVDAATATSSLVVYDYDLFALENV